MDDIYEERKQKKDEEFRINQINKEQELIVGIDYIGNKKQKKYFIEK